MGRSYSMNADYSDEQYVTQMRDMRFVSRQVTRLHSIAAFHVGRAALYSSQGSNTLENHHRRIGCGYFKDLVFYSCELPSVNKETNTDDLLVKIDNMMPAKTPSHEIQRMFKEYSKVLAKVGLLQAYDMRDTALKRFRR